MNGDSGQKLIGGNDGTDLGEDTDTAGESENEDSKDKACVDEKEDNRLPGKAVEELQSPEDQLKVARAELEHPMKVANLPEEIVLEGIQGKDTWCPTTRSWIAPDACNELEMSPEMNGDSGQEQIGQMDNGIDFVVDTDTLEHSKNKPNVEDKESRLPGLGKRKAVEYLKSTEDKLKFTKVELTPPMQVSHPTEQIVLSSNELETSPEMDLSHKERPDQKTCPAPVLANTELQLSSHSITALRKESSAHKVYKAYVNSRRAWLQKKQVVRELWLHYEKCHQESNHSSNMEVFPLFFNQDECGEQVTIVTEMNGNSVQENGVREKSASEEDEQDNQKNQLHETDEEELKSAQDQKKSNEDSICRYEQDVDDPSGQEVEKRDMSGNSVDEDILEFLDD